MLSDRELADKRDADDLRRVAASAGRIVLGRLEQLRSQEERLLRSSVGGVPGGYADSATVLTASIVRGRLEVAVGLFDAAIISLADNSKLATYPAPGGNVAITRTARQRSSPTPATASSAF